MGMNVTYDILYKWQAAALFQLLRKHFDGDIIVTGMNVTTLFSFFLSLPSFFTFLKFYFPFSHPPLSLSLSFILLVFFLFLFIFSSHVTRTKHYARAKDQYLNGNGGSSSVGRVRRSKGYMVLLQIDSRAWTRRSVHYQFAQCASNTEIIGSFAIQTRHSECAHE